MTAPTHPASIAVLTAALATLAAWIGSVRPSAPGWAQAPVPGPQRPAGQGGARTTGGATRVGLVRSPDFGAGERARAGRLAAARVAVAAAPPGLGALAAGDERHDTHVAPGPGRAVTGVVRWADGTPAAGAAVWLEAEGRPGGARRMRAADDGCFRFAAVRAGTVTLRAAARPGDPRGSDRERPSTRRATSVARTRATWRALARGVDASRRPVALELRPGARLEGLVVDDAGAPLDTFTLVATPRGGGARIARRFDGAAGRFVLSGLEEREVELHVSAAGYATPECVTVFARGDVRARVVLARRARLAGQVVDAQGAPLGHAVVAAVPLDTAGWERLERAGADGRFELAGLAPGRWRLASRGAGPEAPALEVQLFPGEDRGDLALRGRRRDRASGQGRPAREARGRRR